MPAIEPTEQAYRDATAHILQLRLWHQAEVIKGLITHLGYPPEKGDDIQLFTYNLLKWCVRNNKIDELVADIRFIEHSTHGQSTTAAYFDFLDTCGRNFPVNEEYLMLALEEDSVFYKQGLYQTPHPYLLRLIDELEHRRYMKDHAGLFISYSSHDKKTANQLVDSFNKAGFRCWIDEKDILIGEPILDRLSEGIDKESAYIVILLSKDSLASEWCRHELRLAYNKEIKLKRICALPVKIDDSDVPSEISIKKYFQLDIRDEESTKSLIDQIKLLVRKQNASATR